MSCDITTNQSITLTSPECEVSICLHCGYDNHGDLDCEENMKKMSKTCLDKEMRKTVKWKLENRFVSLLLLLR